MPDDMHQFLNRLKILRSLSWEDVEPVGMLTTERGWNDFGANPEYTFIRADDPTKTAIWAAIMKRETR